MIKTKIRKELKLAYRDPESTAAALDFQGKGKLSISMICENVVIKRLNFAEIDI